MIHPSDEKRLERLQARLDAHADQASPADRIEFVPRSRFVDGLQSKASPTWGDADTTIVAPPPRRSVGIRNFFIFSALFFVLAAGISAWLVFRGGNRISTDNVDISVVGPTSINGGDVLELEVSLVNRNNIDMELTDLKIYFPEGTKDANNVALEQNRLLDPVGTIAAGETSKRKVRAILFGEENSIKKIRLEIGYRVKNSNAIFNKTKDYDIALKNAPLSIVVKTLKQVYSGQELELTVDVLSNAPQTVRDVLLKVEYGFGFSYIASDIKPVYSNNLWYLGDIDPGQKKTITMRGKLEGQDGDERNFRFSAGLQSPTNETKMEPVFVTSNQLVAINKPFIGTTLLLGGQGGAAPFVVNPGDRVSANVAWVNNLTSPVNNVRIEVVLEGAILDKSSVVAGTGFYRSLDNTILWDRTSDARLASVEPGNNGNVSFSLASLPLTSDTASMFKGAEIKMSVRVVGQHTEEGVAKEVRSTVTRTIRLASSLAVTPRLVWSVGPFTNTGSIPPRVDAETIYTLLLAASNTTNDVRAARMVVTIPSSVRWIGDVDPIADIDNVNYDPDTNQITWDIGELPGGTGFGDSPRQIAVRLGLTPSISQKGEAPVMVTKVRLTGIDRFTGMALSDEETNITTRIATDPQFKNGDDMVVE